jgi:sugar/nucleoside kinase (ribokinase family)
LFLTPKMGLEMKMYDLIILGNYTKDTIVSSAGTRYADGGGFNYGAHAARVSGLKIAAVTRLAREDSHVVEKLENIGVDVYPFITPSSTHMRLEYPTEDVDQRILTCTATAGSYTIDQFDHLSAKAILINASIREEVPFEVVEYLSKKEGLLVADAQGFLRIIDQDHRLINAPWPEKERILALLDVLKADAVEAESLTGEKDIKTAAKILAGWGPTEIVLTHRDGILVYADNHYHEAIFLPEQLVGRSGRGDTCIASYMAKRLSAPPEVAIIWSAAVTSLKMEAEGPILRKKDEVETMIMQKYSTADHPLESK